MYQEFFLHAGYPSKVTSPSYLVFTLLEMILCIYILTKLPHTQVIWDNSEDGVSEWVAYLTNCLMEERNQCLGEKGDVGLTPIYCVVRADKVEVLEKLIELGAG